VQDKGISGNGEGQAGDTIEGVEVLWGPERRHYQGSGQGGKTEKRRREIDEFIMQIRAGIGRRGGVAKKKTKANAQDNFHDKPTEQEGSRKDSNIIGGKRRDSGLKQRKERNRRD